MKEAEERFISGLLQVRPLLLNSSIVSGQNRERLYWANWKIRTPSDRKIFFDDILDNAYSRKYKAPCLLTRLGEHTKNTKENNLTKPHHVFDKNTHELRRISTVEAERLQTLPDNYTAGIPETKRHEIIGNGWTVEMIAHIFREMKNSNGKRIKQLNICEVI
jgi:site-specific DNA-cytosine methylase